jgi:hypothetical protein
MGNRKAESRDIKGSALVCFCGNPIQLRDVGGGNKEGAPLLLYRISYRSLVP